jgi:organic hydroperoxide reductase OsmC/OhrA
MKISARVSNGPNSHQVILTTAADTKQLSVPLKINGPGSSINGGEFLMLALATCYCNDLYRESARLGIPIESVDVEATAEFAGIGLAARDVKYSARIASSAPAAAIATLLRETDAVAEVHNTLRAGVDVSLEIKSG